MELKDLSQFIDRVWDNIPYDPDDFPSTFGKEVLAVIVPIILRTAFHGLFRTEVSLPPVNLERRMTSPTLIPNVISAAGVTGLINHFNLSFVTGDNPASFLLAMDILRDISDGHLPATEDARAIALSFVNLARDSIRALCRV